MSSSCWTISRRLVQLVIIALLASSLTGQSMFHGTLAAASIFGITLADPLASLQVVLATGVAVPAFIASAAGVTFFYFLLGGRTFCAWICPVYFVTELGDKVRERLGTGNNKVSLACKQGLLLLTFFATIVSGLPVFEIVSPIGIIARALAFGSLMGLISLAGLVVFEIVFARRIWCRSLCPLGAFYAIVGAYSPLKIRFEQRLCNECGECSLVCPVAEVLVPSVRDGSGIVTSGDCSRCGLCIDACRAKALKISYTLLSDE